MADPLRPPDPLPPRNPPISADSPTISAAIPAAASTISAAICDSSTVSAAISASSTISAATLNSGDVYLPNLNLSDFPVLPSSIRTQNPRFENLTLTTSNSNCNLDHENPQIGERCIVEEENIPNRCTWAAKLGAKGVGKTKLRFIPPTMVNGEPVIHLQSTQFGKIQQKNANLVIGSFVSKRESFEFVQSIVKKAWKPKGKVTMKLYGRKSFSFAFENEDDKAQALEYGNFHIASQLFLVRPWKLFAEADLKNLETIPIWVLFKKIPEELWDDEGFSRMASAIGEPLFPDRKTELKTKTDYARICIEVKATSTFPTVIPVVVDKKRVFRVSAEYNWKPPRCIHCKVFGHNEDNCSKVHQGQKQAVWVQKKAPSTEIIEVNEAAEVMESPGNGVQEQHGQQNKETLEETIQEKENNGRTSTTTTDIVPTQPTKQTNEWITPGKKNTVRRTKSLIQEVSNLTSTIIYDKNGNCQTTIASSADDERDEEMDKEIDLVQTRRKKEKEREAAKAYDAELRRSSRSVTPSRKLEGYVVRK